MPPTPVARPAGGAAGAVVPKLLRYAAGSGVATLSSEAAFVVLYGLLHLPPGLTSVLAWLAGAVPNYWLNRSWTWRRTGRPGLRDELLPYVTIIGLTLLIATMATRAADHWLHGLDADDTVRVIAVAAVFLGVYVVMFVVRFFLLERLFGRLHARDRAADARSARQREDSRP